MVEFLVTDALKLFGIKHLPMSRAWLEDEPFTSQNLDPVDREIFNHKLLQWEKHSLMDLKYGRANFTSTTAFSKMNFIMNDEDHATMNCTPTQITTVISIIYHVSTLLLPSPFMRTPTSKLIFTLMSIVIALCSSSFFSSSCFFSSPSIQNVLYPDTSSFSTERRTVLAFEWGD